MKRLLLITAILILSALACGGDVSTPAPATYGITYQVECDHNFSVTYENDQGGTEQGDYSKFSQYYTMNRGDFAYLSAQCLEENCDITCKIRVDGDLWKVSSSNGDYVIASCSGSVGRE
jgi:hypothetical protein